MKKRLFKENFQYNLFNAAESKPDVCKRIQLAESKLQAAYNEFVKSCAELGCDTEDELYSLTSIDAVLERYSVIVT
jgi:hypothetical protein